MGDQHLNSLVKWLNTFQLQAPHSTPEEISTGVALAEALTQIDPRWFTTSWHSQIKRAAGTNRYIKISNLKKIMEVVMKYYVECLNQQLIGYTKPDVQKIAEYCDAEELKKLLQLVLGCAINCQEKKHFITRIMGLEERIQEVIKQNIQELEENITGVPLNLGANLTFESLDENDKTQQKLLLDELQAAREEKEQLIYKCTELDQQLCILQEENSVLHSQNNKFQLRLSELNNLEGDAVKTNHKLFELQKQVENLKDEIYKLETSRDDCLSRTDALQKEKTELQRKQLEFQKAADEARNLKDEVDALRENADKALKYEITIESYKKKIEDYTNLRKHVKILEDKNTEYLQYKVNYEEEVKKTGLLKNHLEACKTKLTEVYQELDDQITRSENLEFEVKKLEAELNAAEREKNRVLTECSTLKETNEELRCNQLITTENIMYVNSDEAAANTDFIPPSIREKLVLLEHENKMLKLTQQKESEDKLPLQALLDDSEERVNELRAQNRKASQRVTELENKLEELQRTQTSESKKEQQKVQSLQDDVRKLQAECERLSASSEDNDNDLQLQKRNVVTLQEQLAKKDRELAALEERYKRYVDKAKAVIKVLDPRQQVSSLTLHSLAQLRNRMNAEKRQIIEDMKRTKAAEKENDIVVQDAEETKVIGEQEENMMTTAFHNFGFKKYRDIVDQKFDANNPSFTPSFMTMQRAPTPRKASTTSISSSISRFMREYTLGGGV